MVRSATGFGRRRAIGIVAFTLASLLCGLASNITQFLIACALQGIGGALLVPGSLAIISASFSGAQRGRAISIWSAAATMTAVGPLAGEWIVSTINWRWIFYLNIPLAAVILAILFLYVPESYGNANKSRLDWRGALLAAFGMGGIVFGLTESTNLGVCTSACIGDNWIRFYRVGCVCLCSTVQRCTHVATYLISLQHI